MLTSSTLLAARPLDIPVRPRPSSSRPFLVIRVPEREKTRLREYLSLPLPSEMRAGSVKLRGLSFFYKSNLAFLDADADDGDRFNWFIASNFNYDAACSSWVGTGLDWTGLDWTRMNSQCKIVGSGICLQPGMRMTSSTSKWQCGVLPDAVHPYSLSQSVQFCVSGSCRGGRSGFNQTSFLKSSSPPGACMPD